MIRIPKLVLGLCVLLLSGGIVLAYIGLAEPYVSPSQLPGTLGHGFVGILVLALGAVVVASVLDSWAWRRMGRRAGFSPEGWMALVDNSSEGDRQFLSVPDLTGTVHGRPVRARTYMVGGGQDDSSTTHTVVETDLERTVGWSATVVAVPDDSASVVAGIDSGQWTTVDGFAVIGDVPEDVARAVLSTRVQNELSGVGSVHVGDAAHNIAGAMLDTIPDESGSLSHSLARGMLSPGTRSQQGSTAERVGHGQEGLLLDPTELERRAAAVAVVAEAVERTDAGTQS